eukprot:TRINITY_DN7648_c0_g1_i1.p1 TRINITY_DN7648_c0_g1~~TRINITY_DN7648_c0_g1_i1.p1  ORF type:complete len:359 (+),score=106.75 TRINITY_DN7648_c0_g1_i1:49-1125(+)
MFAQDLIPYQGRKPFDPNEVTLPNNLFKVPKLLSGIVAEETNVQDKLSNCLLLKDAFRDSIYASKYLNDELANAINYCLDECNYNIDLLSCMLNVLSEMCSSPICCQFLIDMESLFFKIFSLLNHEEFQIVYCAIAFLEAYSQYEAKKICNFDFYTDNMKTIFNLIFSKVSSWEFPKFNAKLSTYDELMLKFLESSFEFAYNTIPFSESLFSIDLQDIFVCFETIFMMEAPNLLIIGKLVKVVGRFAKERSSCIQMLENSTILECLTSLLLFSDTVLKRNVLECLMVFLIEIDAKQRIVKSIDVIGRMYYEFIPQIHDLVVVVLRLAAEYGENYQILKDLLNPKDFKIVTDFSAKPSK